MSAAFQGWRRLGNQARELAGNVRAASQLSDQGGPGLYSARSDLGLGAMVKHETASFYRIDGDKGGWRLARPHKKVVGEPSCGQCFEPADHIGSLQPARIWLALDEVAGTNQCLASGPCVKQRWRPRHRGPQVDPAYDT